MNTKLLLANHLSESSDIFDVVVLTHLDMC